MPKFSRLPLLLAVPAAAATLPAQAPAPRPDTRFALTVDSIMRGPDLVGYPPEALRWSADSSWADEYKRILKLFEDNLRLRTPQKTS